MTNVIRGGRPANLDVRSREHLTNVEIWTMIKAIRRNGRNRARNAALIEIIYRHGLRVSEAVNLRWDDVSLAHGTIQVRRLKGGRSALHPLSADEIKTLKNLHNKTAGSAWLFPAEGGGPLDRRSVYVIIRRAGKLANISLPVHPHMLRHSRGYKLVNNGVDIRLIAGYLGHNSLQTTMRYTFIDHNQFEGLSEC